MTRLKVSVFFLEDRRQACPTIRLFSPLGKLEEQGRISLATGTQVNGQDVDVELEVIADSDIVIIQRQAARTKLASHIFKLTTRLGKKVIVEMDDLLINTPESHVHAKCLEDIREGIIESMNRADAVTCSTALLRRELSQHAGRVFVLPNLIDTDIWSKGKLREDPGNDRVTIAYAGTPTHFDDLEMITPAIKVILNRFGDRVTFRFWGCITEELLSMKGVEFAEELIPDYRSYANTLAASDINIAICPLEENSFNACKSNIKFLEFAACGIPGVFSHIQPYSSSVKHLETGLLADNSTESWSSSLDLLITNHALRAEIAKNAYKKVLKDHILEPNLYRWETVLNQVAGR